MLSVIGYTTQAIALSGGLAFAIQSITKSANHSPYRRSFTVDDHTLGLKYCLNCVSVALLVSESLLLHFPYDYPNRRSFTVDDHGFCHLKGRMVICEQAGLSTETTRLTGGSFTADDHRRAEGCVFRTQITKTKPACSGFVRYYFVTCRYNLLDMAFNLSPIVIIIQVMAIMYTCNLSLPPLNHAHHRLETSTGNHRHQRVHPIYESAH